MHLRPLPLVGSCLAASDSHVWPHWEGLLLSRHLSIAVEQNGSAALVLMQQTAVLKMGYKGDLALQKMSGCLAHTTRIIMTQRHDQSDRASESQNQRRYNDLHGNNLHIQTSSL